ncbi:hypothetical protein HZC30_03625 [Candidatus Woesearchaeota archaeon]|nr:hypothetical protein [Candidatus Woesearchaeota archaeon]
MALAETKPEYEQYAQYVGEKVAVIVSESTGYFSGRDYECESVTPTEEKRVILVLEKITPKGLEGCLENEEHICIKYWEHQEKQLSSELEAGIQRYQIIDRRVCKVEPM